MSDSPQNKKNDNKDFKKLGPFGDFNKNNNQNNFMRNMLLWMIIVAGMITIYFFMQGAQKSEVPVSYTKYRDFLESGKIESAKITKTQLNDFEFHGVLNQPQQIFVDGRPTKVKKFVTKLGVLDSQTEKSWEDKGITWTYEEGESPFWNTLISILPLILLIVFFFFIFRRMQSGSSKGIFTFGKSRAKLHSEGQQKVTFDDVAGADEAKYELQEVIEFLKEPKKFQKLGGKIPRGD